jgi:hypothetical protein
MFYRVTADLFFLEPDEGLDFYHDCERAYAKSVSINIGQPDEEHGVISLHKCHHDETPQAECEVIANQPQQ